MPLEAALRGIDAAFDKHDAKAAKSRARKVNGLAWCAQSVMERAQSRRGKRLIGAAPEKGAEVAGEWI